jgi:hypothetical protein
MQTLKSSSEGLERIRIAREKLTSENGWAVDNEQWLDEASKFLPPVKVGRSTVLGTVSIATWKRFLSGKAVKAPSFRAFCMVLKLDWEEIAEVEKTSASAPSQQNCFFLPEKLPPIRKWFGRSEELDTTTAICIVGLAGIGKTTLTSQLIHQIHTEGNPFIAVAWESLRSITGKPPRFDGIIDSLLSSISNSEITVETTVLDDYFKKTERLINLLRDKPCLIVIDNVETVLKTKQSSRAGYFSDDCSEYAWLFQQLVENNHNSKVVFTSREMLAQLKKQEVFMLKLSGLDQLSAIHLLESLELIATVEELAELAKRYDGHPKALELVAAVIQEDFQGRVSRFLRDRKWLLVRDIESLLDEVINRLNPFA